MADWKLFRAAAFGACLCFASPCLADDAEDDDAPANSPNVLNATGLLLTPNAGILAEKHGAAQFFGSGRFNTYGGLVSPHERLEFGISYVDVLDSGTCLCDSLIVNAKLQLLESENGGPMVSVGVIDLFDEFEVDPSWYLVASQDLSRFLGGSATPIVASLGYGGGMFSEEWFAGLEVGLGTLKGLAGGRLTGIFEYTDQSASLGMKLAAGRLSATLAYFDTARWGGGITYTHPLK